MKHLELIRWLYSHEFRDTFMVKGNISSFYDDIDVSHTYSGQWSFVREKLAILTLTIPLNVEIDSHIELIQYNTDYLFDSKTKIWSLHLNKENEGEQEDHVIIERRNLISQVVQTQFNSTSTPDDWNFPSIERQNPIDAIAFFLCGDMNEILKQIQEQNPDDTKAIQSFKSGAVGLNPSIENTLYGMRGSFPFVKHNMIILLSHLHENSSFSFLFAAEYERADDKYLYVEFETV